MDYKNMISEKALDEFKKIYKKEAGEEISDREAYEKGNNLVNFFRLLYKIDRRNKIKKKSFK
ncbi:MAG: hypothetical protein ABH873_04175 [Candidatus Firestonebacteria bacterium]